SLSETKFIKKRNMIVLPKIPANAEAIFKMMKSINISNNEISFHNRTNKLESLVAIRTHSKVLHYSNGASFGCIYQPKSQSQSLTMQTQYFPLGFLLHVNKHQPITASNISSFFHSTFQFPQQIYHLSPLCA
ncbi:hypothetical protein PanWU01x14_007700, partial [Parasponia andersonii]